MFAGGLRMNPEIHAASAEFAHAAARRHGRVQRDGADDHDLPIDDGEPVLPAVIFIEYLASERHPSQRIVTLRSVWKTDGVLYCSGACHLRHALRTFRVDRIKELICLATGEVASDPGAWLMEHAQFAGEVPRAQTSRALAACRDELAILAFVANADGYFDPDEMEVAIDLVMMSSRGEIDRVQAAKYVGRLPHVCPDLQETVDRVAGAPDRWERLQRSLRRLVDADRELPIAEQVAVDEVQQAHTASLARLLAKITQPLRT